MPAKNQPKVMMTMFVFFIAILTILNLFTPDRAYSQRENRRLTQLPTFSKDELFSGRFTRKFEDYITDQFNSRDSWVLFKGDIERLLLRTENNGIFFGRQGWLLENYRQPGSILDRNIQRVNDFQRRFPELKTSLVLVPNSVAIYPEKLPIFASPHNQRRVMDEVKGGLNPGLTFINLWQPLRDGRDEYIYFRTDHHWTMRGAYIAYLELATHLGYTPLGYDEFIIETVSKNFWGTYSARANNRYLRSDHIEVFRPKNPLSVELTFNDKPGVFTSLYFPAHLETRDKYSYFLDEIHPLAIIRTDNQNGRKLAVFKDSYAHNLLPFLAHHYQEIHVIDLRFFSTDLGTYLGEQGIDEALFLFNVSSFSSDRNMLNFR
jgi:hypothetical protein